MSSSTTAASSKRNCGARSDEKALDVHYQPIVSADGIRIVGAEALLRWTHPVRGAIPPMQFVPVAEQSGLMGRLGEFVLRRALVRCQALARALHRRSICRRCRCAIRRWSSSCPTLLAKNDMRAVAADARSHRGRADRQSGRGQGPARCAEGARHPAGARRFRHRLFQPDLSAALQLRQAQDRPGLRRAARPRCRQPARWCRRSSRSAARST